MISIRPLIASDSNEVVKKRKVTFTRSSTSSARYFWNSCLATLNQICLHFKDFTTLRTSQCKNFIVTKETRFPTFIIYRNFFDCSPISICLTQAVKDGRLSQTKTVEFRCFCLFSPAQRTDFPSQIEFFMFLAKFQSHLKTCLFGTEFSYPVRFCVGFLGGLFSVCGFFFKYYKMFVGRTVSNWDCL